jgi:NTP pyrophosphatase (non-canonical NTP hydrolase)
MDDLVNLVEDKKGRWNHLMNVTEFQQWVKDYYKMRGWSDLDIFIRIGFLAEETGEVARAIRALEIGRDRPDEVTGTLEENKKELTEELGDVLGNLIVIANKYDISLEEIFSSHKEKLAERYSTR